MTHYAAEAPGAIPCSQPSPWVRPALVSVLMLAVWALPVAAETGPVGSGSLGSSVESLLNWARQNNPEFATARYETIAAVEKSAAAGTLPDPKLSVELRDLTRMGEQSPSLLPNQVGSTRYLLTQEIPWFGKRGLARNIAELEAQGTQSRQRSTWTEVAARIKIAYAQIFALDRNRQLVQETLETLARLEKNAQIRYSAGLGGQQDIINAQAEKTALKGELLALQGERQQLVSRINVLLARPTGSALAAPQQLRSLPSVTAFDFAQLRDRLLANNPLLQSETTRLQAAEKSRELTAKNRYPDFMIGVAPTQYRGRIKEWEVMVGINIPLWQGSRRAQEREAQAMVSAAQTRLEAASAQVMGDLEAHLVAFNSAQRIQTLLTTQLLPQAKLNFKSVMIAYQNSKIDMTALLLAQQQIRLAQQNEIKAQADTQIHLAEIERLLGEDS